MNITTYLTKMAMLLGVLCVGTLLKQKRIVPDGAFGTLSSIVSHFTLPCAILSGCRGLSLGIDSAILIVLGIGVNLLLLLAAWLDTRRAGAEERLFRMLNTSALNIGNFAVPLLTGSAMASALPSVFFFDIGNALMGCGGNYAISGAVTKKENGHSLGRIVRQLSKSVTFDLYVTLIVLALLKIELPGAVYDFADYVAAGNSILVMLFFGIGLNLRMDRSAIVQCLHFFALRYGVLVVLSFAVLFLPFSRNVLIGIAISMLSPISTMCVIFTRKSGGDHERSSTLASLSILLSFAVVCACLPCWQLVLDRIL